MPQVSVLAREASLRETILADLPTALANATPISHQSLGLVMTNPLDNTEDMVELRVIVRRRIDGVPAQQMLTDATDEYRAKQEKAILANVAKLAKIEADNAKREAQESKTNEN